MKACIPVLGESGELHGLPHPPEFLDAILRSREGAQGELEFLVRWKGQGEEDTQWLLWSQLVELGLTHQVEEFLANQR